MLLLQECCRDNYISLQAILATSYVLVRWTQTGHKDGSLGTI
jgi:hypothetical protein